MADDSREPTAEDEWSKALHTFVVERFRLVQEAAKFWLGTMTTLVGLFSALLVINRGEALAALSVGAMTRLLLYGAVVAVYACAFIAVILAAQASFGGLTLPRGDEPQFWSAPLKWAGRQWTPLPMEEKDPADWDNFRRLRQDRANRSRKYLHRSRALGIAALAGAAVLALVVLALGGLDDDARDPTYVVVVHDGQVTCGSLERTTDGRTLIGGQEFDGVSQLTIVEGC